jgi:hypothetical protein
LTVPKTADRGPRNIRPASQEVKPLHWAVSSLKNDSRSLTDFPPWCLATTPPVSTGASKSRA